MKAEVELPTNLSHMESFFCEADLGAIRVRTMHYSHTSELTHEITIHDGRTEKFAFGKEIFSGTIEDLIKRLIGQ
jgi:hypothetical protein